MLISHKYKIAFSRTKGAADAAVEIALRNFLGNEGMVATKLPFYGKDAVGADSESMKPYTTAAELRLLLGPDYNIIVVKRNVLERIWSQYCWQRKIGFFSGSFEEFVSGKNFDRYDNLAGANIVLDFNSLSKELSAMLDNLGIYVPNDFSVNENDGKHFVDEFRLDLVYNKALLFMLNEKLPEAKTAAKTEPIAAPIEAPEAEPVAAVEPVKDAAEESEPDVSEAMLHEFFEVDGLEQPAEQEAEGEANPEEPEDTPQEKSAPKQRRGRKPSKS